MTAKPCKSQSSVRSYFVLTLSFLLVGFFTCRVNALHRPHITSSLMRRVTRHNNVGWLRPYGPWTPSLLPPFWEEDDHSRSTPQTITTNGVCGLCMATSFPLHLVYLMSQIESLSTECQQKNPCLLNVTKNGTSKQLEIFRDRLSTSSPQGWTCYS